MQVLTFSAAAQNAVGQRRLNMQSVAIDATTGAIPSGFKIVALKEFLNSKQATSHERRYLPRTCFTHVIVPG